MPNAIVNTDGSSNAIFLSVTEELGHHIQTIIRINNVLFADIEGDIIDLPIGNNVMPSGTAVAITTTAVKISPAPNSVAVFKLNGVQELYEDRSKRLFNGDPIVTHHMTYDFL